MNEYELNQQKSAELLAMLQPVKNDNSEIKEYSGFKDLRETISEISNEK
jgi:hypothetical protein